MKVTDEVRQALGRHRTHTAAQALQALVDVAEGDMRKSITVMQARPP